jgi:hypothetical protein
MTNAIGIALTLVAVGSLWYTIRTFREACRDKMNLILAGRNGAMVDLAYQGVIREANRLVKHSLIVIAIAIKLLPVFDRPEWRDDLSNVRSAIILVVALLLAVNSKLDLDGRRRVIHKQHAEIQKALQTTPTE